MDFLFLPLAFIGMEVVSLLMHRYLFHGPLWFIHQTHHAPGHRRWEWNDLFSLFFAALAIFLIIDGIETLSWTFFMGCGISWYGIIYFILHDWFIHGRYQPFRSKNKWLLHLRKAHWIHHRQQARWPAQEFGLFWTELPFRKKDPDDSPAKN